MDQTKKSELADKIINLIGEEKDKLAYEWLLENFPIEEIEEAINIAQQKETAGQLDYPARRYFMGVMKMKARQKEVPWLKKKKD